MTKVITYGTYDLLHYGHIRLLERAKALGDYLIVGVTADDFDKTRGKINVQQSLMERVEAVRATGIADEIVIEEYEGQKIDDIKRYKVDIFTVGSDWVGYFDYLKKYCEVVYLDRTEGVSSTEIRSQKGSLNVGLVGDSKYLEKVYSESAYANGIRVSGICADEPEKLSPELKKIPFITRDYKSLLDNVDAVYIHSLPERHYELVQTALLKEKHVLCESPIALSKEECAELLELASEKNLILTDSLRTAYSTAYHRLLLMIKSGKIGEVVSVDAVCTSLMEETYKNKEGLLRRWNSITGWGPTALLPVFQILGTKYRQANIVTHYLDEKIGFDAFTKISFIYDNAVASIRVGTGAKSEGELIVSGTKGYIYVPAPWWKTDYFEVRYEDPANNKRYFYQLDGEGIRYELVEFARSVAEQEKKTTEQVGRNIVIEHPNKKIDDNIYISRSVSLAIAEIMERYRKKDVITI